MALYSYIKRQPVIRKRSPATMSVVSGGIFVSGIALIFSVVFPIAAYQLKSINLPRKMISPIGETQASWLAEDDRRGVVLGKTIEPDYTRASSWYPVLPDLPKYATKITNYTLSIPKLGIKEAVVQIGGEDLMKGLVQYPGTSMPGQYGNAVVFGHSVLPQFFNPKNYRTIFSTLPKLQAGDEILINFDGIAYKYIVLEKVETPAGDVSVLEQHYDDEYLSLITCVPPGTYLKRLIVRAVLTKV